VKINYLERIPYNEFIFEAVRSRGPGGQNVNKTNSAVILRWSPSLSTAFSQQERELLLRKLPLTDAGELYIRSEESRSQEQNKSTCLKKLVLILEKAFFVQKRRIKTKPTRSSQRKRIEGKSHRSDIKKGRGKIRHDP
jgi:ribosome-associated protein